MKKSNSYTSFRSKFIREHKCPRKGLTKEAFNEREQLFKLMYSIRNAKNDLSYATQSISTLMTFLNLFHVPPYLTCNSCMCSKISSSCKTFAFWKIF